MHSFSAQTFDILALLTPYDIDLTKRRIGNERDGAYILVDQPSGNDIMSFGISNDTSFEEAMAARGHRLFLYDHTIPHCPTEHPAFTFRRSGICGAGDADPELRTLAQHLADIPAPSSRMTLKIDVEGAEWDVFSTIDQTTLARFDQIVIELHWLRELTKPAFAAKVRASLEAINAQFTLYHVHANNCAPVLMVNGFMVADVIEVSYVRTALVERRESRTVYPSPLNRANRPDFYDHALLFFPFLPSSADCAQIEEMVARVSADYVPTPRA